MKILSWNVNGLSACMEHGFVDSIMKEVPDIILIQETKGRVNVEILGYQPYYNPAQRHGYSGTMVLSRVPFRQVQTGFGVEEFDCEGRCITLDVGPYFVVCVYMPNSQASLKRFEYRKRWDTAFCTYIKDLKAKKPVVIGGDFNVVAEYIDIYGENTRNIKDAPGFERSERDQFNELLRLGFFDSYRLFYPNKIGAYTWWSNRLNKREQNRGWRIDYFLVDNRLKDNLLSAHILDKIKGSDHCPIMIRLTDDSTESTSRIKRSGVDLRSDWDAIDWELLEDNLWHMQSRLTMAAIRWNCAKTPAEKEEHALRIKNLQKWIVRSESAKALAVRQVCGGKVCAGIDGVVWDTSEKRMEAALSLTSADYVPSPYKRIFLRDANGKMRSINLLTMYDRAMHVLYNYSLDPVAEAVGDRATFAFRKGRSALDIHPYIIRMLEHPRVKYLMIGDIAAFYESIQHEWLLENTPMDSIVLGKMLHAGQIVKGELYPSEGISLASSLSPTIANLCLRGLQKRIYEGIYGEGRPDYTNGEILRFADDFIISATSRKSMAVIKDIIVDFLSERGLRLSESKTKIIAVVEPFSFLSRRYQKVGNQVVCVPDDRAVEAFEEELKDYLSTYDGSISRLIAILNGKLRGFASYHRITDAEKAFRKVDAIVQILLLQLVQRLHPKQPLKKLQNLYWRPSGRNDELVFADPQQPAASVIQLKYTPLATHKAVKTGYNPYLQTDISYYEDLKNRRDILKYSGEYRKIWLRQSGRCYLCGEPMLADGSVTLVQLVPSNCDYSPSNLAYCHQSCRLNIPVYGDTNYVSDGVRVEDIYESILQVEKDATDPYQKLRNIFFNCPKSSVTLSISDICAVIEDVEIAQRLTKDKTAWDEIKEVWEDQGYQVHALKMKTQKVTFHRFKRVSALKIPDCLLNQNIPQDAKAELEAFFRKIIDKYAL